MENNNSKERWIEEVMNSMAGMDQVQPRHDLYSKIMTRLNTEVTVKNISMGQ